MPASPTPPEFFVDRGLGRVVVPEALRAAGVTVHTMAEIYRGREQEVPDTEWLTEAGRQRWIVLTKDRRIRRRPTEIRAIAEHGVRAFVLARGSLTGVQQAEFFGNNLDRIVAAADVDEAVVYQVYATHIRRLWPTSERRARR